MRDPITLLEMIGADANLMGANAAKLGESPEFAGLAPALRSALLEGNFQTFRELLRAPDIVCCLIDPSEEEDDEEEDVEEEDEDDEDDEDAGPVREPKPRCPLL